MQVAEIISELKDPMVREVEMSTDGDFATTPSSPSRLGNREEGEGVRAKKLEVAKLSEIERDGGIGGTEQVVDWVNNQP